METDRATADLLVALDAYKHDATNEGDIVIAELCDEIHTLFYRLAMPNRSWADLQASLRGVSSACRTLADELKP